MIFIIRGHIRNAFKTNDLYNFIKKLYKIYPDLKIFIHTWNIFSNKISWRKINIDSNIVVDEVIYNYFGDLKHLIKHIIVDDDTDIKLIGNLQGTINNGPMPIIGWKNYWYGKHKIIDFLYNMNIDENETVVNCRFDVMDNSVSFDETTVLNFIKNKCDIKFTKNVFLFDSEQCGVDNIYIGNINTMYRLSNIFFNELDDILSKNNDTIHQEKLVYRMNNVLFD